MTESRNPAVLVRCSLLAWAVFSTATCLPFVIAGDLFASAGIGLSVVTIGLVVWSWRSGEWIRPLFAALYSMAIAMTLAGALASADIYVTGGVVALAVVSVGAIGVHQIRALRRDP